MQHVVKAQGGMVWTVRLVKQPKPFERYNSSPNFSSVRGVGLSLPCSRWRHYHLPGAHVPKYGIRENLEEVDLPRQDHRRETRQSMHLFLKGCAGILLSCTHYPQVVTALNRKLLVPRTTIVDAFLGATMLTKTKALAGG